MKTSKKNIYIINNNFNLINKKEVIKSLNKNKFVILRGLFNRPEVEKTLLQIKKKFNHKKDKIRPKGKYNLIKTNYQRLMFGSTGGLNETNPRYFRVFYNPLWCEDIYKGKNILIKLNKLQNFFYNLENDYGEKEINRPTRHGLFVASRFQHYPSGGGFLAPHIDLGAIRASKELNINLHYNFLLVMTQKGKDYKKGGGYVINKNKFIDVDNFTKIGDVVIYSSKTKHGVADIDPDIIPNLSSDKGRYVALTTLFKW